MNCLSESKPGPAVKYMLLLVLCLPAGAEIDEAPLTRYLKPAFFDAYGTDNHFGFKVSFGVY